MEYRDFIQPYAEDLEQAIIGVILGESNGFSRVENTLVDSDFYNSSHATIYQAAQKLCSERKPIDIATIADLLTKNKKLEEIGGPVYLAELMTTVGSSAHLEYHASIVKQKAVERAIIGISQQATKKIYEGEDIADVIFWQGKEIEKQQEALVGKQITAHISAPIEEAISEMYHRKEAAKKGLQTGLTTGLNGLDKITGGWQNSDLVVIAARPAMGKTAFALHFAKEAAKTNHPVAMFSLEMSDVSLANRLLLSECNVGAYQFRSGKISNSDSVEIEKAAGKLCKLPIYVDDNASVSMSYIRSKARLLRKQGKCDMVIIDYLQLATDAKNNNRNREQEIAQMSREAKIIAKELSIPVLLLSQLSREVEKRTDKKPMLSDLRESGAIEQDADMVCFIHRPEYYGKKLVYDNKEIDNGVEFIISKFRNGSTGSAFVQHDGTLNKIFDINGDFYQPVQHLQTSDIPF